MTSYYILFLPLFLSFNEVSLKKFFCRLAITKISLPPKISGKKLPAPIKFRHRDSSSMSGSENRREINRMVILLIGKGVHSLYIFFFKKGPI